MEPYVLLAGMQPDDPHWTARLALHDEQALQVERIMQLQQELIDLQKKHIKQLRAMFIRSQESEIRLAQHLVHCSHIPEPTKARWDDFVQRRTAKLEKFRRQTGESRHGTQ